MNTMDPKLPNDMKRYYNTVFEQKTNAYNQKRMRRSADPNHTIKTYSRLQSANNSIRTIAPKTVTLFQRVVYAEGSPDINKIIDAFQNTLGKQPICMNSNDIILLQFDFNESLRQKYVKYAEDVKQFCKKLELLSTLPLNELHLNQKNWLDVLLLRSCWWFGHISSDEHKKVIRVNNNYGLQRDHNKQLEPLFSFAETIEEMKLDEIELSLSTTYILLLGAFSFLPVPNEYNPTNQKSMTAQRRDYVLKLLYNYQKEKYPNDDMRYVKLLTNLSELFYISGTS